MCNVKWPCTLVQPKHCHSVRRIKIINVTDCIDFFIYSDRLTARHFGTGAEVSVGQFGTGAELSGQIGTISLVPKCLGAELSWCRSVRKAYTHNNNNKYLYANSVAKQITCDAGYVFAMMPPVPTPHLVSSALYVKYLASFLRVFELLIYRKICFTEYTISNLWTKSTKTTNTTRSFSHCLQDEAVVEYLTRLHMHMVYAFLEIGRATWA